MPKSRRYPNTELPGTVQRSCREAQEAFLKALDEAVRTHGTGDQAHRLAYTTLKRDFEKRGDHWIAKHQRPASLPAHITVAPGFACVSQGSSAATSDRAMEES